MKRIASTLLVELTLTILVSGQSVESGWKGILPLLSSKADVEKAYGKPERIDDNGYHNYRMEDSFVQVNFATEPCRPNQYNRGKFNVAANTVLDLWVSMKKRILLEELNYDRPRYLRDAGGHDGMVYYFNRESSIMISASAQDAQGNEHVGKIDYRPAEKLRTKFACN